MQGSEDAALVVLLAPPGANLGWSVLEGEECVEAAACDAEGMVLPVLLHPHPAGCAVIGGVVDRGEVIPQLDGRDFYGDFSGGRVRSFRFVDGRVTDDWSAHRVTWVGSSPSAPMPPGRST